MAVARQPTPRQLAMGAGRAFAGATLLALPVLMTMEMWHLGAVLHPWRVVAYLVVGLQLVFVLVWHLGFWDAEGLTSTDHLADALVSAAVGTLTAAGFLLVLGVIDSDQPLREVVRLVAVQSVPCSIGAAIARSQLAGDGEQLREESSSYPYEVMLMAVGALVFSFSIAPTEEVVLIAADVSTTGAVLLAALSILLLHALVYMLGFRGQHRSEAPTWSVLLGYTVVGYGVCLLVCLALLWVFDRTSMPWSFVLTETVVLALPAAVGAGAARLLL